MSAYEDGFNFAWDRGGAMYERSSNIHTPGTEDWKRFYAGYMDGCKDVAEHRKTQRVEPERAAPAVIQPSLNI